MNDQTLWIVSPLYHDVEAYLLLRARLPEVLAMAPALASFSVRYLVVDDSAGTDPEIARIEEFGRTRVLTPPFNLGHQRALVFGVRRLRDHLRDDDIVVTMDSDGEDKPEDVPRLVAPLLARPDALNRIAIARRTRREESLGFKVLYAMFKLMFRGLTGTVIQSGNFAAYRGWVAKSVLRHPHFDLCYSSSLIGLNLPLDPVPCERGSRYAGRSRMNMLRLVTHGIQMLMPFLDRVAIRSLVGFSVLFALGMALALVVLAGWALGWEDLPQEAPWLALFVMALAFMALGNFILLFAHFAQNQGALLANVERYGEAVPRKAAERASAGEDAAVG